MRKILITALIILFGLATTTQTKYYEEYEKQKPIKKKLVKEGMHTESVYVSCKKCGLKHKPTRKCSCWRKVKKVKKVKKAKACKKCKKVHTVKKVKKAKAKPKKKAKKKVKTKKAKNCPYCGVSKIKCKCGPICNCPPGKCTCNVIEQATNITPLATCEKCGTRLEDGACPICAEEEEGITEEKHAKSKWCPHCKMKITKCRCVI